MLNLFLALLLSSFSADNLSDSDENEEPNSIALSIERVKNWINWCKRKLATGLSGKNDKNNPDKENNTSNLDPLKLESAENLADDESETQDRMLMTGSAVPIIQQSNLVMAENTQNNTTNGDQIKRSSRVT